MEVSSGFPSDLDKESDLQIYTEERINELCTEMEHILEFDLRRIHMPLPVRYVQPALDDDQAEVYWLLTEVAQASGSEIIEFPPDSIYGFLGINGFVEEGQIHIRQGDTRSKSLLVVHELAHLLLHHETDGLAEECLAETASYIVARYLGFSNPYSAEYLLRNYVEPAYILECVPAIVSVVNEIIGRIEGVRDRPKARS